MILKVKKKGKAKRIQTFLKKEEDIICAGIDRTFRILLIIEWFAGIGVAYFISPKTWSGIESQVHIHLIAAIFLGAAILFPPIILGFLRPGARITRYAISCGQMLFGCLLIHLMGGRSEAHFYLFGTLAFLAAYRKWKVLIPATVIVTLDHIIRGVYWPQSIYGVISGAEWRWVEHAFWIVFEDIFLVITIVQGRKDMIKMANTSVDLEMKNAEIVKMNDNLFDEVEKRTDEANQNALLAHHNSKLASIGALAAGVGHEINNPLTIIQGNINKLFKKSSLEYQENQDVKDCFYKIDIALKKTADIVLGLRTFVRNDIEEKSQFNLKDSLEQTVLLVRDIYHNDAIEIKMNILNEKMYILGGAGKLQQVFMNLISNAKDAIHGVKNPLIEITLTKDNDKALIIVKDNGHGMPVSVQGKVFDAFFTTKDVGKGTGIGLSLSHSIIQEHDGNIRFETGSEGTSFFLTIPLSEKTVEKNEEEKVTIKEKPWKGKKALVIDDEELVREIIVDMLNEEELIVTEVSSGEKALALLLEKNEYDFIFCDMKMPKMNGLEFIEAARNINLNNKPEIVLVTGGIANMDSLLNDKDVDHPLLGCLFKPFSEEDLYQLLLTAKV
jgi:signal transduction histidine kinase/CheY-like chemotaxis protein